MKTKILLLAFALMGMTSFSQQGITFFKVTTDPQSPIDVTPLMTPQQADAAINAASQTVTCILELESDTSARAIIKLGTDSTNFNIYNQSVNLNGAALPTGTSVLKNGEQVRIILGAFSGLAHFVAQIEIESAAGKRSRKYLIIH